jgi:putative transposase
VGRFVVPDGWTVQAFAFALDCTPEQAACVRRQFGGRRYARNWAVRTIKDDIARYREAGQETEKPSLAFMRKRWNRVKDTECADAVTGQVWSSAPSRRAWPTRTLRSGLTWECECSPLSPIATAR